MPLPTDLTDLIDSFQPRAADPAAPAARTGAPAAVLRDDPDALDDDPIFQRLVGAVRHVESGGNKNAISPQGASGSMQIMPGTFAQYRKPGEMFSNDDHRTAAAIRKLKDDYIHFGGDPALTAAAYIGGRGAVGPDGQIKADRADAHGTTPVKYADMILGRMGTLSPEDVAKLHSAGATEAAPQGPQYRPFDADFGDIMQAATAGLDGMPKPPVKSSGMRRIADAGIDLAKGIVDAGQVPVGLAELIPGVSKVTRGMLGYDPEATNQALSEYYGPARKAAEQNVAAGAEARENQSIGQRFLGGARDLLANPSVALGRGVESIPSMLEASLGAVGKARQIGTAAYDAAMAAGLGETAATAAARGAVERAAGTLKTLGAVGEGVVSAGQTSDQILQQNPNGNQYAAIPAGLITGGIGRAVSAIPGMGDATTSLLTGAGRAGASGGMIKRGIKGFVSEGPMQEAPQSASEQFWQNVGTGDPLGKGVAEAAGQGLVMGGMMGGAEGVLSRGHGALPAEPQTTPAPAPAAAAPIQADANGQMNLLLPDVPVSKQAVDPRLAGPLAPEQVDPRTGEQLSLGLEPVQADLFNQNPTAVPHVDPRQAGAGPLPAEAAPAGTQLEMPVNQPRPVTDQDAISRHLAAQAEQGALGRIDQPQQVVTPGQLAEQNRTAETLHAAAQAQEAPAAQQLELPGQATPNPDARVATNNPTLADMQTDARRKAASGELLSTFEAHLLTMPQVDANPNAQIEVPPASNTKSVPTQGDLFGSTSLDQPAASGPRELPARTVQNADSSQASMFDAAGRPTYGATPSASNVEVAEQFGKEFSLKPTDKRKAVMAAVGRMYYDGKISFDDATHVAEMLRASKYGAAEREVIAMQKESADKVQQTPAAPAEVGVVEQPKAVEPQPVVDAEKTSPTSTTSEAPTTTTSEPQSVMGTPLEETRAVNREVTEAGPNMKLVSSKELVDAAENGDHPFISVRDAEAEMARRQSLTNSDKFINDYFVQNFPVRGDREAYLKRMALERDGVFRTRDGAGSGYVTPEEAQSVVDATAGKWKGAPQIEVVENKGGLPADLRTQMERDGADPKGAYYNGKVYVVSDAHTSTGDVLATIMHEVAGHHGLRSLLGQDYAKVMNQVYNGNPEIRKAADAMMQSEGLSKEVATEEALADIAQKGNVKPALLEKIANAIRQFLRSVGLGKFASGVTNAEVKALLSAAKDQVVNGKAVESSAVQGDAVYRTLAELPEPTAGTFMTKMKDIFSDVGTKSPVLGLMTTRQLVEQFHDVPALKKLADMITLTGNKTKHLQNEVAAVDKLFERLTPDETKTVAKVMIEATTEQMHVDKNFRDEENMHLDRTLRTEFEAAKARYDAMPQKLKDVYIQTRDKFAKDWAETNALIKSRIVDQYADDLGTAKGKTAAEVAKITKLEDRVEFKKDLPVAQRRLVSRLWDDIDAHAFELKQVQGPYFPLMRFGDHAVVAKSEMLRNAQENLAAAREALAELYRKDESEYSPEQAKDARAEVSKYQSQVEAYKANDQHYLVEFYESKTEADNRVRQIKELTKDDPTMQVERSLREAYFKSLDAAPYGFMQKLQEQIAANLPTKDSGAIKQAVRDLYIRQMPERAALKQQLKRLNVQGVKAGEMRRAVIASGLRHSFNIARMQYAAPLNDALGELRRGSTDTEKKLGEEMAKRMTDVMTVGSQKKLISGLSNLSYVTMLGLSPSFLMMNLTQPWTVSLPLLAARHGFAASGAGMAKATAEIGGLMMSSWKEERAANGLKKSLHFAPDLTKLKDQGERDMIAALMDRGIVDVTQEHDLSALSQGDTSGWTDALASASSIPAHHSEIVNRLATALVAYRLEKALDLKNNTNNALAYTERIIADSHLDYTAENTPRLMRGGFAGGLGKLLFQFKKYQQGMIYLNFKLLKQAIAEKRITGEAGKAWMYLMGAQIATAGAMGTPLTGILAGAAMIAGAFGPDDEDKEYKQMFYNGLKESVGETMARLIMKGVPAALLNIDLSNRAGMGDILNPMKYSKPGTTGQDTVANALLALSGPTASLAANWSQAIMELGKGNMLEAARAAAPRFIQGPLDAYAMSEQGLVTKRGNQYRKPDEISPWDYITKAATFTSADMADLQESRAAVSNATFARDNARHELLNQYAKASIRGADINGIMEKIADFNTRNPERGVRIDQGTLIKSRRAEMQYEKQLRNGVRVAPNAGRIADEMGIKK